MLTTFCVAYLLFFAVFSAVSVVGDFKKRRGGFFLFGVLERVILFWLILANWIPSARQLPRESGYVLFSAAVFWLVIEFLGDEREIASDSELRPNVKQLFKWSSFVVAILLISPALYLALTGMFLLRHG